jgi:hypothetical protein
MRNFLLNTALLLAPLLVLEGAFRFLPVAYLPQIQPVSAQTPVARFEPNVDYRYSRDWNFSVVTRKRSNNYGFINALDYQPEARSPLLAVIGDSLVEANQVAVGESVSERLHAELGGRARVYSLGISGAPLSQYLVYAEYARNTFRADAMAFVIAPNDFEESLLKYKTEPRFHYFAADGKLQRLDYELSTAKQVLRQSAVLRYAMQNLDAWHRLEALVKGPPQEKAQGTRLEDSYRAVDWFLDQVPEKTGLGRDSIVFVVDPLRPAVYTPATRKQVEEGVFGRTAQYFAEQARARGYEVIELQPVFLRRHAAGDALEVGPTDSHWNALGHRIVAEQLAQSAVFRHLSPPTDTTWNTR